MLNLPSFLQTLLVFSVLISASPVHRRRTLLRPCHMYTDTSNASAIVYDPIKTILNGSEVWVWDFGSRSRPFATDDNSVIVNPAYYPVYPTGQPAGDVIVDHVPCDKTYSDAWLMIKVHVRPTTAFNSIRRKSSFDPYELSIGRPIAIANMPVVPSGSSLLGINTTAIVQGWYRGKRINLLDLGLQQKTNKLITKIPTFNEVDIIDDNFNTQEVILQNALFGFPQTFYVKYTYQNNSNSSTPPIISFTNFTRDQITPLGTAFIFNYPPVSAGNPNAYQTPSSPGAGVASILPSAFQETIATFTTTTTSTQTSSTTTSTLMTTTSSTTTFSSTYFITDVLPSSQSVPIPANTSTAPSTTKTLPVVQTTTSTTNQAQHSVYYVTEIIEETESTTVEAPTITSTLSGEWIPTTIVTTAFYSEATSSASITTPSINATNQTFGTEQTVQSSTWTSVPTSSTAQTTAITKNSRTILVPSSVPAPPASLETETELQTSKPSKMSAITTKLSPSSSYATDIVPPTISPQSSTVESQITGPPSSVPAPPASLHTETEPFTAKPTKSTLVPIHTSDGSSTTEIPPPTLLPTALPIPSSVPVPPANITSSTSTPTTTLIPTPSNTTSAPRDTKVYYVTEFIIETEETTSEGAAATFTITSVSSTSDVFTPPSPAVPPANLTISTQLTSVSSEATLTEKTNVYYVTEWITTQEATTAEIASPTQIQATATSTVLTPPPQSVAPASITATAVASHKSEYYSVTDWIISTIDETTTELPPPALPTTLNATLVLPTSPEPSNAPATIPVTTTTSHNSQFYSVTEWIISTVDESGATLESLPPTQTGASTPTLSAESPPQPSNAPATILATTTTNSHNSAYYSVTEWVISTVDETTVEIPPLTLATSSVPSLISSTPPQPSNAPATIPATTTSHNTEFYSVTEWIVSTEAETTTSSSPFATAAPTQPSTGQASIPNRSSTIISSEAPPQPSNAPASIPATVTTNGHNSAYYSVTEWVISTVDETTVESAPSTLATLSRTTFASSTPPQPSNVPGTIPATTTTSSHNTEFYSITEWIVSTEAETATSSPMPVPTQPPTGQASIPPPTTTIRKSEYYSITEWIISTVDETATTAASATASPDTQVYTLTEIVASSEQATLAEPATVPAPAGSIVATTTVAAASTTATILTTETGVIPATTAVASLTTTPHSIYYVTELIPETTYETAEAPPSPGSGAANISSTPTSPSAASSVEYLIATESIMSAETMNGDLPGLQKPSIGAKSTTTTSTTTTETHAYYVVTMRIRKPHHHTNSTLVVEPTTSP